MGSVLYNRPVPATAGVSITLDQYQYGGTGADGIGFFLVDGSTNLTEAGAPGGSLGYAQRNAEPGIRGGVLGVGLDAYGNFYDDGEGRGAGCPAGQRSPSTASGPVAPNVITLRGPGSGTTGYCYLASTTPPVPPANPNKPGTTLNGGTGTLRASTLAASWRQVNIQVTPAPSPRVIVQVRYRPGVTGDPWITELDVPAPAGLPRTYKFGLSASTGGSNDVHLIRNALVQSINPLSNLQLEKQVDRTAGNLPPVITAGTVIPYQYTVTNAGLETLTDLAIADDKITGPITCDRTSLLVAPAPGSTTVCRGTYTVTAADVQAGQVTNTATAAALDPGADTVTSPPSSVTVPLTSRIALTKSVQTPPPYSAGQVVQYGYTVTNTGGSTLSNVAVTDDRVPSATLVCQANVLAPSASTTCTGSYTVNLTHANPAGRIVNTARANGTTPIGQSVQSPPAQASIAVNTDIGVTKAVDNATPDVGATVTFTVRATNNGPAAATNVVITDQLPVGRLTLLGSSTSGPQPSTYTPSTGAWSIPALAVGNTVTLVMTARVDTNTAVANAATLSQLTQTDINGANDTATVTLNPVVPVTDLAVTKEVIGDRAVPAGQPVTFRVTVRNNGPRDGTGITLTDALPPQLTYRPAGSGGDGTYDPATDIWTVGSLAVGASASFDFVLDTISPGTFTNAASLATVTPTDANAANNSASATVTVRTPIADLAIVKGVFPQEAVVGETVTYQIEVTNRGPDPVLDVYVTDLGPEGITVLGTAATQGTVNQAKHRWDVGTLPRDGTARLTVTARLDTPGTKVDVVVVDAPLLLDPDPTDNQSTATLTTLAPAVDVGLTKTVARFTGTGSVGNIPIGQDAVFTLTATNRAVPGQPATTATDVVFTDVLEPGLDFVELGRGRCLRPRRRQLSVPSIAVGQTVTRTIRVTGTVVGQHTNTISLATLDQRDTDPTNNWASASAVFVELADLEIQKGVDPATAQPGDIVDYTITVTNNGPNATDDTLVNDPALVPANIVAHTTDNGTFDPAARTWTIPRLEADQTATLVVSVRLSSTAAGNYQNLAVIQQSRVTDPNPDDNTATADLFVPVADIAVDKGVNDTTAAVGETVTFSIGVRNLGPDAAADVAVTDVLPAGLAYVASSATLGTYDPTTGVWAVGDLEPADLQDTGHQATLSISARVTLTGTITNTATSDRTNAFPYDPDHSNNADSVTLNPSQAPALHLTKTANPAVVAAPGQLITYSFVVTNVGGVTVSAVAVVEDTFTGTGTLPPPTCPAAAGSLAPGASVTCTTTYAVTAGDIARGELSNTAHARGTDRTGSATLSPSDGAVVEVRGADLTQPRVRTRTSHARVTPGQPFWDRVRITRLAAGTSVPVTARLYGPFTSRAASSCRPSDLVKTVTWRAGDGWSRSPSVRISDPGHYTWRVSTGATAMNGAATHRCGLAAETTLVAKPPYVAPAVAGGFSGTLPRHPDDDARPYRPIITGARFGLRADHYPCRHHRRPDEPTRRRRHRRLAEQVRGLRRRDRHHRHRRPCLGPTRQARSPFPPEPGTTRTHGHHLGRWDHVPLQGDDQVHPRPQPATAATTLHHRRTTPSRPDRAARGALFTPMAASTTPST